MEIKKIDPKAPRFRRTNYQSKISVVQLHKEFVESTGIKMDKETFKALYEETMDVISHFITTERDGVALPENMGQIHLSFFKTKRRHYRFQMGIVTGYSPINPYFDSNGLQGKICWDYKQLKFKHPEYGFYGFVACRELKRQASHAFINTPELFKKNVYIDGRDIEKSKKRKLERDERNKQRGNQSTEGSEQGS